MTKRCAALVRLSCVPSDFSQSSSVIAVVAWGSPARLGSARLGCALEVNVRLVCIHQWFDMCAVSTWTVFPAKYLLSFQMNCPQLLTTVLWTQSWSHMHRGPVGPARENFVALPWQQDAYTHTHTHTHTHTYCRRGDVLFAVYLQGAVSTLHCHEASQLSDGRDSISNSPTFTFYL